MRVLLIFIFCVLQGFIFAHEGHHEKVVESLAQAQEVFEVPFFEHQVTSWTKWVGSFHLIFLHFPIALINMVAISELLFVLYQKPIFDYSSRFMLIFAAILTPPTALLGWIYSHSAAYEGFMHILLLWHQWFGICTALLVVVSALVRELIGRGMLYYCFLVLTFLMLNSASYFGGRMAFGS